MKSLDEEYPLLSGLIRAERGLDLEALAKRAPAQRYEYFDLERQLHEVKQFGSIPTGALADLVPHIDQARGYLATIERYLGLGILKNSSRFVTSKLLVPATARSMPPSSEFLDTMAECSWALWLDTK